MGEPYVRLNVLRDTGGACLDAPGRCPNVSCRYHVLESQHARAVAAQDLSQPCAIRLGDREGMILQEIADVFGVTRQGANVMLTKAEASFAQAMRTAGMGDVNPRVALAAAAAIPPSPRHRRAA